MIQKYELCLQETSVTKMMNNSQLSIHVPFEISISIHICGTAIEKN